MTTEMTAGNGALVGAKDALVRDLKGVVGDADALIKEVAVSTAHGLADARTKVGERLSEVRIAVTDRAKGIADVTQVFVKENPWKVLGGAAAVGIIIGFLLSRR